MKKCIVFACQGIEPCQANADAGTRRPQVRTRFPQVRTRFLLAMKKINDRLASEPMRSNRSKRSKCLKLFMFEKVEITR